MDELNGEKIDIVRWNESSQILIGNALKPAEVAEISLCFELGRATVVVRDDQLSLAIGKRGQNVRLAARLTGWDVDILTPEEFNKGLEIMSETLLSVEGMTEVHVDRLAALGMVSVFDLEEVGAEVIATELEISTEEAESVVARCSERAKEVAEQQQKEKEEAEQRRLEEEEAARRLLEGEAVEGDVSKFYEGEILNRKRFSYPPFTVLIKISSYGTVAHITKEMETLEKILEGYPFQIFPAFSRASKNKFVLSGLLKIPYEKWPEKKLVDILKNLPQNISVNVRPESAL